MSRIRAILIAALIAAFAMSVASAAAEAHEYRVAGKTTGWHIHIHGLILTRSQVLLGTPFGVATHIICKHLSILGTILPGTVSFSVLSYSLCEASKPANCKVKEPIEAKVKGTLVGPSPGVEEEFAPESGETFAKITLEGTECAIKEPFNVTGTQTCKLPGGETEAAEHEVNCETSGSKLKAVGKTATYEGGGGGIHIVNEAGEATGELWSAI